MRIGLIGYGKMGKAIERIALERGHTISFKSSSDNPLAGIDTSDTDIAIEFTRPELVVQHIYICLDKKLPVVVGTTAWTAALPDIKKAVEVQNGSLLYASNFSVGVNIVFQLNELLARLMENQPSYKASIEEIHHVQKLDAPSGTAVSLAEGLLANNSNYNKWVGAEGKLPETKEDELAIAAFREPNVPGTHVVRYESAIDTIELTHTAHNRDGFALGSVLAAEFLATKKGIYTMRDVLSL